MKQRIESFDSMRFLLPETDQKKNEYIGTTNQGQVIMSEKDALKKEEQELVPQVKIPLANATLVLSIVSVAGCVFYGFPGIVLAVLAIVFHHKTKKVYLTDRPAYRKSYENARAGWIIAIISLCISIATTIYTIYVFYVLYHMETLRG